MGSVENSSMKAGEHDIRNTATEWMYIINGLDDPAMLFLVAESLAGSNLVRDYIEDGDPEERINMTSNQLARHALEKYFGIVGSTEALFDKLLKSSAGKPNLALRLEAVDLIIRRANLEELHYLHIFLNSYRDFFPWELLKIKVKDVFSAMNAVEETQEIMALSKEAVSGTLDGDK